MRCVVCGASVEAQRAAYANAWEASLGLRACCGPECTARFDADAHWMPSSPPPPASDDELRRLSSATTARVAAGEPVAMLARDLLLAGVEPETVRRTLAGAAAAAAAAEEARRQRDAGFMLAWSAVGGIGAALSALLGRPRAGAPPRVTVDDILATWTARFPA